MKKRSRIIVEIIRRIREMVGVDFPILVKLNSTDGFDAGSGKTGLTPEDAVEIAKILEKNTVCAIEVSGGIMEAGEVMSRHAIDSMEKEAYFKQYARMIKSAVNIPVILVGGIRTRSVMESLIKEGYADMVSMSRPFINEPDLVVKLKHGEIEGVSCISCNRCFDPSGIKCYH